MYYQLQILKKSCHFIILNELKFKDSVFQGHKTTYTEEMRLKHQFSWDFSESCPVSMPSIKVFQILQYLLQSSVVEHHGFLHTLKKSMVISSYFKK